MSVRKEASRRLGVELQIRYRKMLEAVGQEEISIAAMDLGKLFNDNIEQIIWFLRAYGGDKTQSPLERG